MLNFLKFKNIFRRPQKNYNNGEFIIDDEESAGKRRNLFKNISKKLKPSLLVVYAIFVFISYYLMLVPISPFSVSFYGYIIFLIAVLSAIFFIDSFSNAKSKAVCKTLNKIIVTLFLVIFISNIYALPIFHAKKYASLLKVENSDFAKDVAPADFSKLPVVDRSTAEKLGARKMGEMGTLVSQYNIDLTYSQTCISGKPVRVTPLVYSNIIKWFFNYKRGIPYYISIDMVTQHADLVKLEKPIKYSLSDKFQRDIIRYIRFKYPTKILGEINFEVDEKGHPYWIAPIIKPNIGLFSGYDVKELITVDAVTGEFMLYDINSVPDWIDRVYPSNMILKQLTDFGMYSGGFLNSFINQVGVTKPTDGYNYMTLGNDIYLYTGITSVLSDESNIGFVFINSRTKEAKFYPVSSAEEFSVMASAAGAVQEKGYNSTFPLIINVDSRPTYFMSLKDNADLVKMYALVDAQSYQKVAVGDTVKSTLEHYRQTISDLKPSGSDSKEESVNLTVNQIEKVVIDGNTVLLIKPENSDIIYAADINVNNRFAFLKPGDTITVKGYKNADKFTITEAE